MPSPGATVQLWLQPPLFKEHWSAERGCDCQVLILLPARGDPLSWCPALYSPQSSPSSEPSPQSSEPSQSFSGGRQMEVLLAQVWEGGLHTSDSQFSSSELSSQSLSPSQTQALLMQRAAEGGVKKGQIRCRGDVISGTLGPGCLTAGVPPPLSPSLPS